MTRRIALSKLKQLLAGLFILAMMACGDSSQDALNVPSDVTAVAGPKMITVSWTDNNDNEDVFIVYRRLAGADAETVFEVYAETEADLTTFTDTEVELGQTYVYAVAARAQNQETSLSEASEPVTPTIPKVTLSVTWLGEGQGKLLSEPAGLECVVGDSCSASFDLGTQLSLSLSPRDGTVFLGWGGACSGTDMCTLTLNETTEISATLQTLETLTVLRAGQGSGTVTSNPAGIECTPEGLGCSARFPAGTSVSLTGAPAAKSVFAGWSGACRGETCVVEMTEAKSVTATFEQQTYVLSVEKTGPGTGEVSSISPAGIDCGDDCAQSFVEGTVVSLEAKANAGSRFTGWRNGCEGTGTCRVTLTSVQKVSANFTYAPPVIQSFTVSQPLLARGKSTTLKWAVAGQGDLELSISGGVGDVSGKESVVIAPRQTTTYTLTARSQYGTATARVKVTVGNAPTITSFKAEPATILRGDSTLLSWGATGDAPVTLRLSPGNRNVSGETNLILEPTQTTSYKLTASNRFGTAEATVTVTVQAAFELSVTVTPRNGGRVVSVPAGISCGRNAVRCSAVFVEGTAVRLGVVRGDFERWQNCPQAIATVCSITMTQDLAVTAIFDD